MKKSIIIIIVGLVSFIGCKDTSSSSSVMEDVVELETPKTAEELRQELKGQEELSPTTYLTIDDAKMREDQIQTREANFFQSAQYAPDGNTIYGNIKNTASIARFKDVVVTVTFYSQTETEIETKDHIFYEFYEPNSLNYFELKVYPPEATASFNISVKNAVPVQE